MKKVLFSSWFAIIVVFLFHSYPESVKANNAETTSCDNTAAMEHQRLPQLITSIK